MRRTILTFFLCAATLSAQSSGLKIVVLTGEDAVNVIQKRTAVAPLVEVRDVNNLPVPGATVTFTVGGQGGATFGGGASTLTVTTNAAGQAAAAGLTPTGPGTVQISVAAGFQGQTAAATIAQTNVLTAAAGGLSTGAIVGIVGGGAAVAGGLVVAGAAGSGDGGSGTSSSPNQPTAADCVFVVSPTTVSVPVSGGTVTISVSVSPATGSGTVTLTVAPFSPTPNFQSRSDAIGVANTVVQILQPTAPQSALGCVSQQRHGTARSDVSTFELGSTAGMFDVTFAPGLDSANRMLVVYEGLTLFDSGCGTAPPVATRSISYAGRSSTITVQVSPACGAGARAEWQYQVACPR